jgi:enoyl-CoA hydratase/carnithine racemase
MDAGFIVAASNGVVRLKFNRPETRNALTSAVCAALQAQLVRIADDPECRALVIEGSEGAFVSGADVAHLQALRSDRPQLLAMYRQLRATQEQLYALTLPTVALIDGFCMGAGLSLAMACDLRVATARSEFAASPARLGLIYSRCEVSRLVMHIGAGSARDLLFTGRRVDGAEALHLGLIQRLVRPQDMESALAELLREFAGCAPSSLRKSKQQLLRLERLAANDGDGDAEAEDALFQADAAEGMRAFLERRAPRFSSR